LPINELAKFLDEKVSLKSLLKTLNRSAITTD